MGGSHNKPLKTCLGHISSQKLGGGGGGGGGGGIILCIKQAKYILRS